ncbi:hypothetical protein [Spiroplasma mirum]|uniref:hypothetical protein n=1 Tax=Spiroplasma mirum TaxID=2144 RepID=UPI0003DFBFFC|nr:hypothetical protein [Spiroplasma atrichopogonis]AHF61181.1 hypothetical protein SMM_0774 [Spiroplasma mirum ATCC 29335]
MKIMKNYYWKRIFFRWFLYVCFDIRYQPYEKGVSAEWEQMEKEKWDIYQRNYYGKDAPNQDLFKHKSNNNAHKSSTFLFI